MYLLGIALAPIVAIAWFIYLKDRYEHEPSKHLLVSFFLGCLSVIPAIFLEYSYDLILPNNNSSIANTAFLAFVVVAFSEEISKYLMLNFYAYKLPEFDEPMDGIVYGVMVSLGFAAVENLTYVFIYDGGWVTAILRMFTAVPAHASFGVFMGFYFGYAWLHKKHQLRYKIYGLFIAVLLHGTYDFFLLQNKFPAFAFFSFIGLAISIRFSLKAIKIHQNLSPHKPLSNTIEKN